MRGISLSDRCQLDLLDEQRQARFDRELASAKPFTVLAAFQQALADPTDQKNASLIRWVDGRHRMTWTGAPVEGDALEALRAQAR